MCINIFYLLLQIGEKSLFTKELENALERNEYESAILLFYCAVRLSDVQFRWLACACSAIYCENTIAAQD